LLSLGPIAIAPAAWAAAPASPPATQPASPPATKPASPPPPALRVTSPAFREGAAIPVKHTCDGADVSPALAWTGVPKGAKSLALVCDDPDAPGGTWVHWVLYGLATAATGLPEGVSKVARLPDGTRQGMSDFKAVGYGGPCPPPGKPHRYYFRLYALDAVPEVKGTMTRARLDETMRGHVLAEGRLMGTYRR